MSYCNDYSIILDSNLKKRPKITKPKETKDSKPPLISEYKEFRTKKYTVTNLKFFCKYFRLKVTGTKNELVDRIYEFLLHSFYSIKIQTIYRKHIVKQFFKLAGPGFTKRENCKNDTDFFTLEELKEIRTGQFFSFKENNNIWGFNVLSIYNLFLKSNCKDVFNPYTRDKISNDIYENIKKFIKISKLLKFETNVVINKDNKNISEKKQNENKCLELFQIINELGNYSDYSWFINLNRVELIQFIRELVDIWEYRASLTLDVKKQICSPYGNPFRFNNLRNLNTTTSLVQIQKMALTIIHQLITKGVTQEHCNLGASYVLCALTLVSTPAAESLPWLYQSVSNN